MNYLEMVRKMENGADYGQNLDMDTFRGTEYFDVSLMLYKANRNYVHHGISGNYLDDFINESGDLDVLETVDRLTWEKGDAFNVGRGLEVRSIEDYIVFGYQEQVLDAPADVNKWGSVQYSEAYNMYRWLRSNERYSDYFGEVGIWYRWEMNPQEVASVVRNSGRSLPPIKSFNKFFTECRGRGFDLWTVARYCEHAFWRFSCSEYEGRRTGLVCWLLMKHGMVTDESVFCDFDS